MRQANGTESETWGFGWGNVTQRNEIAAVYICSSGCIHGRRVYSARPVYTVAVYTATRACIHGHRVYSARPIYTAAVYTGTLNILCSRMTSLFITLRYVTLPHPKPQVSLPVPLACLIKTAMGRHNMDSPHSLTPTTFPHNYLTYFYSEY